MLFEKKDRLFIGRFGHLLEYRGLIHGFSTRKGGVSPIPYDSLNLGLNTEDAAIFVKENRKRFLQSIGLDETRMVIPGQIHADHVHIADSPGIFPDTDAVVTSRADLVLSVQVADCLPIFLYDPVKKVAGLVHAGWKGSTKKIASKTIQTLVKTFGVDPADLRSLFGPSIGPCCYQVGKETAEQFDPKYICGDKLDLWQCNADQLADADVKAENMVQSRLCTVCHPEWFYSHRASRGKTGRMLAVLGMRE